MAEKQLESSALSAFFGSIATMLSAGIQTDEAAVMLSENRERSRFQEVCNVVYEQLVEGKSLADAMASSEGFPPYAVSMVRTGEQSGHLEQVLRNLEMYYDEESRMFDKLRSAVGYPAALLVIMTVILAFTVLVILPVFAGVYENMAGTLADSSASSVGASGVIGMVALVITVVCAVIALWFVFTTRSESGRQKILGMFEHMPFIGGAMYQLALSRFTAALATYVSSGITNEDAMTRAITTVDNDKLKARLQKAADSMIDLDNPRSLTQAISEFNIFEPLYARMLNVGMRSGSTEETLAQLSGTFFDDAILQIDRALDHIEPILAAFLTVAVGATLIAVMLPLIGIMGSIG
ncbi:MAG: type II secretion system F family protein [Eggerthellaceae bacterium]|nr:type II secretion system F family protein [Eggerthellaceae bacterium]